MEAAVAQFRSRMAAANRAFLSARIAEQRGMPYSDLSRVYALSRFWFRWDEGHKAWQRTDGSSSKYPRVPAFDEQCQLEAAVKTLDHVAALPHFHMDGTEPPHSAVVQRDFLNALEDVVNDYSSLPEDEDRVCIPEELAQFLAATNGVHDPDFRHSGVCDFSPIPHSYDPGKSYSHDLFYEELEPLADPEHWPEMGMELISNDWDIAAGVLFDQAGQWPDLWPDHYENRWYCAYAYCRSEETDPWSWRVIVYLNKGGTGVEYDLWSFATIAEFLVWYASWPDRLNDQEMRRATSGKTPRG